MDRRYKEEVWRFPVDEEKKRISLQRIDAAARSCPARHRASLLQGVLTQLKFQSAGYWLAQGVMLSVFLAAIHIMKTANVSCNQMLTVLSIGAVAAGNVALSGIGKIFSWHMAELEQTLYWNLKQMTAIQMLLAAMVDLLMFSFLMLGAGGYQQVTMSAFCLYLLVPFLWADFLYLKALTSFRGGMRGYRQMSVLFVSVLLALLPLFSGNAYEAVYLPVWCFFLAAGLLGIGMEIRRLFRKIEEGEMLCQN